MNKSGYITIDDIFPKAQYGVLSKSPVDPVSTPKTFYVLARPEQNRFAPVDGTKNYGWVKTAQESKQYPTLEDAIRAFPHIQCKRDPIFGGGFHPLFIVKVTETPGTGETRRELEETELALSGETVKYAIYGTDGGRWRDTAWNSTLAGATLYSTQRAAVDEVQKASQRTFGIGPTEIRRIAVKANEPVITETVLA